MHLKAFHAAAENTIEFLTVYTYEMKNSGIEKPNFII